VISAVFFPPNPEASFFDLTEQARAGIKRGLRLYTNGRQMALLPKPLKGWAPMIVKHHPDTPPCAA
jgi:hypothetical protein